VNLLSLFSMVIKSKPVVLYVTGIKSFLSAIKRLIISSQSGDSSRCNCLNNLVLSDDFI